MYFPIDFFDLINDCSYWNISIGLYLDWYLLVMNVMLWFFHFNDKWLLNNLRHVNWMHTFVVLMYDFVHVKVHLFRNFDDGLYLYDFLLQKFNLFWNFNVLDGLLARNLTDFLDLYGFLDADLYNLRNCDCVGDCFFPLNDLRNFQDRFDDFLSDYRLLNDELYRNLVFERYDDLSVLYCDLMDLNNPLDNSVAEDFNRNLPNYFSGDSPFDFYFLRNLFLDHDLNDPLLLNNFNLLYYCDY